MRGRSQFVRGQPRRLVRGAHVVALGVLALLLGGCGLLGGSGQAAANPLQPGRPVRLQIPAIGLNWPVVPVGRDATGAMNTPQGPESAPSWHEGFWWEYGYLIGQPGNAVIAGHVDDVLGNLTPFAHISRLQPGDAIYVLTDHGGTFRYVVTRVALLPNPVGGPTDPTVTSIFGAASSPHLNLITCSGDWVGNEFAQRLVVFATLAQDAQT